jgi:hypothetical protein
LAPPLGTVEAAMAIIEQEVMPPAMETCLLV